MTGEMGRTWTIDAVERLTLPQLLLLSHQGKPPAAGDGRRATSPATARALIHAAAEREGITLDG